MAQNKPISINKKENEKLFDVGFFFVKSLSEKYNTGEIASILSNANYTFFTKLSTEIGHKNMLKLFDDSMLKLRKHMCENPITMEDLINCETGKKTI